jgi:BirA family biotin operon repressor/biotin-[acetyl-CoA-carboxylase] ligase
VNDALDALDLRTRWLGRAHEHHAVLESTNDRAAAWARAGAPHGALVTADAQTRGRGRLGRVWHSPAGASVYASVVVRPVAFDARWAALGLAVGVGIVDGLAGLVDGLALKWPNDVQLHGRKLAGILCESRVHGDDAEMIVGFGINVHRVARPPELAAIATSLEDAGALVRGRADALARVLDALEPVLDAFATDGFPALRERYEARSSTLGGAVEIAATPGEPRRRVFAVQLADDGALLVRPEGGGPLERIEAGDVDPPARFG